MGWNITEYVKGDAKITYIDVTAIDGDLEAKIEKYIAQICYGDNSFSNSKAKKYIRDYLTKKKDGTPVKSVERKMGAIAEFILHVYLNSLDISQECCFKNLEEKSPKKGFDGIYREDSGDVWYMESKSGSNTSAEHKDKVSEAYRDLEEKFSSKSSNDPWLNAYYHAKSIDPTNISLLDKFKELSEEYDKGTALDMNDFSIIPAGTLFLDDKTKVYNSCDVGEECYKYFKNRDRKGLHIICVSQASVAEFETYLNK